MIQVGIIGGTGFTAGELMRLLVHHPEATINFVYSHSQPGERIATVHEDLLTQPDLRFTDTVNPAADVIFLCLGHGKSRAFLEKHPLPAHTKVIDLGNDFRLRPTATFGARTFVYGLPELRRDAIKAADSLANPGCFATAIQLALLPLAKAGLLRQAIHVHAITGATGAGRSLRPTTHFSWRTENVSIYKAFSHQHLDEIRQSLDDLQPDFRQAVNFLPVRGNFTRGIFASAYINAPTTGQPIEALYDDFYQDAPFTQTTQDEIHLKQVVNTNFARVQAQELDGKWLIIAALDNLLKGASGQAVQNMNLMFGLPETNGLQLKASYF